MVWKGVTVTTHKHFSLLKLSQMADLHSDKHKSQNESYSSCIEFVILKNAVRSKLWVEKSDHLFLAGCSSFNSHKWIFFLQIFWGAAATLWRDWSATLPPLQKCIQQFHWYFHHTKVVFQKLLNIAKHFSSRLASDPCLFLVTFHPRLLYTLLTQNHPMVLKLLSRNTLRMHKCLWSS